MVVPAVQRASSFCDKARLDLSQSTHFSNPDLSQLAAYSAFAHAQNVSRYAPSNKSRPLASDITACANKSRIASEGSPCIFFGWSLLDDSTPRCPIDALPYVCHRVRSTPGTWQRFHALEPRRVLPELLARLRAVG